MLPNTRSLHGATRNATLAINAIFAVVIAVSYGADMVVHAAVPEVQVTKARIDSNYRLRVDTVNTATGAFKPANGQGVLADIGAAPPSAFGNGPYITIVTDSRYRKLLPSMMAYGVLILGWIQQTRRLSVKGIVVVARGSHFEEDFLNI